MKPTTIDEFEAKYADGSGVTIEWLHSMGHYGAECHCDYEGCQGFQMGHFEPGEHEAWIAAGCPSLTSWPFSWWKIKQGWPET